MLKETDIFKVLKDFYANRASFFQEKYNRLVSFGDMVSDRWEKARLLGFGEGASIYDSALVMGNVTVGEQTWIGPQVLLDGLRAALSIGSHCSISAGVQIYTHDSVKRSITGGKHALSVAPTSIGNNVYIGPNTIIGKGVTIGNHVIVGTQSYVNASLPDYAVAWGQPAKVVGKVVLNQEGNDFEIQYN
jgi:acetyltransferase-like isoleucine patch superfamily enzyme